MSIGTHATKRAAEVAYARSLTELSDGTWAAPLTAGCRLGVYATRWLETRLTNRGEPLRPRVRELYQGQCDRYIVPDLGDVACDQLTTAMVRAWIVRLRGDSGPGVSTAAKWYRLQRSIMATAVQDGVAKVNPCTIKGAGVEPADERPVPTVAEVPTVADAIGPRFR